MESGFEFWSGMSQCCYILTVACHREILIHMARLFSLASPTPYMMSHLQGLPVWLGFSQHGGIRIVILLNWLVSGCPETGSESCESPKTWIQKLLQLHFGHIQLIKSVTESNQIQGEGHRLPTYQWEECQRTCAIFNLPQSALWSQITYILSTCKMC